MFSSKFRHTLRIQDRFAEEPTTTSTTTSTTMKDPDDAKTDKTVFAPTVPRTSLFARSGIGRGTAEVQKAGSETTPKIDR